MSTGHSESVGCGVHQGCVGRVGSAWGRSLYCSSFFFPPEKLSDPVEVKNNSDVHVGEGTSELTCTAFCYVCQSLIIRSATVSKAVYNKTNSLTG